MTLKDLAVPAASDLTYVHGVRADDEHWPDVWNFSLAGTRGSVGLLNAVEGQTLPGEADLEVLRGAPSAWPGMFMSGFLVVVWQGAIVRTGLRLGRGVPPYRTRWVTEEQANAILRATDRELALEAGRRKHSASAPSRLSCLWLAEATANGRNWVHRIMGANSFVMDVRISICHSMARCDARWLERVHEHPDDVEAVRGYWSGRAFGEQPTWEYLLEGQIAGSDSVEIERLREFVRVNGPPKDLIARAAAT